MGQKQIDIPVVINNKVYTLSGFEGEEYLQNVATYINGKIAECKTSEEYRRMNIEYQGILLALNIADDYFKAKKQIQLMEEEMRAREKEIYDLKHELISNQIKLENSEKTGKKLTEKIADKEKEIITLQAKLDVHKSEKQK